MLPAIILLQIKQIKTLKKTQVNNGKELQISRKVESKPWNIKSTKWLKSGNAPLLLLRKEI